MTFFFFLFSFLGFFFSLLSFSFFSKGCYIILEYDFFCPPSDMNKVNSMQGWSYWRLVRVNEGHDGMSLDRYDTCWIPFVFSLHFPTLSSLFYSTLL